MTGAAFCTTVRGLGLAESAFPATFLLFSGRLTRRDGLAGDLTDRRCFAMRLLLLAADSNKQHRTGQAYEQRSCGPTINRLLDRILVLLQEPENLAGGDLESCRNLLDSLTTTKAPVIGQLTKDDGSIGSCRQRLIILSFW